MCSSAKHARRAAKHHNRWCPGCASPYHNDPIYGRHAAYTIHTSAQTTSHPTAIVPYTATHTSPHAPSEPTQVVLIPTAGACHRRRGHRAHHCHGRRERRHGGPITALVSGIAALVVAGKAQYDASREAKRGRVERDVLPEMRAGVRSLSDDGVGGGSGSSSSSGWGEKGMWTPPTTVAAGSSVVSSGSRAETRVEDEKREALVEEGGEEVPPPAYEAVARGG